MGDQRMPDVQLADGEDLGDGGNKCFVSCLDGLIDCLIGSLFSCGDVFVAIGLLISKLSDCILSGLGISLGLIYHLLLNFDFVSVLSSLDLRLCLPAKIGRASCRERV